MRALLFVIAVSVFGSACQCGSDVVITPGNPVDGGGLDGGGGGGGRGGGAGGGGGHSGTFDASVPDAGQCDVIVATVRDFKDTHPDFEQYQGSLKGIVTNDLNLDERKPVYAHTGSTAVTSGPGAFRQWYRDDAGVDVNRAFRVELPLTPTDAGTYVYDNSAFFPIDGRGFGNQGRDHNFHFTTEIHTIFTYNGGEYFTFRGDDDVWVFVNKKLALDLGGVHGPEEGHIDFDAQAAQLGLTKGQAYSLEVFHAERHTSGSNFRVETTIGCFTVQIF